MYFFDKKGRQYARRTKINTGYKCNLRCQFCYYYDNLCKLDDDFNGIKKQLDYAKKIGIQHIDFSGGESTIHKDFIKMVSYSRKLGFKTICTLTNGSAFSNMEYLKKSKDAGLNEILFSLHGTNRENHDEITQVKGSYDRLLAAIKNAHALGIKSRFNVTVNKINYRGIVNQTSLINELKPFQVNYIVFNEWADGKKVAGKLGVNYPEVSKEIKKAVDHLKGIKSINVRYIPFCFMKGYEKYITNTINHLYDPYEWYPYARAKFEANSNFKFLFILFYTFLISRKFNFNENLNNANKINYTKIDKCKNCKLRKICGGFTKTYLKLNPKTDVIPYSLKEGLIKDPIFFKETSQFPIEKKDLTFIIANDPIKGCGL